MTWYELSSDKVCLILFSIKNHVDKLIFVKSVFKTVFSAWKDPGAQVP